MRTKYLIISLFILIVPLLGFGQNLEYQALYDQKYGEYDRNVFDLIIPNNESPHSLVIYIHGGGFKQGDKSKMYSRKKDIKYFIDNNVAVATINYRFYKKNDSLGVKVCLADIKRAIQFIRFNAGQYNIDKTKVACYGVSAGAGSSLYFAFHDEMAIPGDTTLLGESTRLNCAGAIATQSTYNLYRWKGILPWFHILSFLKRDSFNHSMANFYGYADYTSFKLNRKEIARSLDMLDMIDSDDPPVYLINLMKENFPDNNDIVFHHRNHAIAVSKKLNKFNIQNYLFTKKNAQDAEKYPIREFLVDNLK